MMLLMQERKRERERKLTSFPTCISDYIYITFTYNNVLFLNILFRYNTLLIQEKNTLNKWHYFQGVPWA